jgi:hypothetical protein
MTNQSNKVTLLSSESIKQGQDTIKKNLINLDTLIHDNAVQCLLHCSLHNDPSLMVRLLVDVIDEKSGYRRQGLISWMRKHSPMELKGKTINLSGLITSEAQQKALIAAFPDTDPKLFVVGERRPFLVEEANKAPFTTDPGNKEMVKPLFQGVLLSPINSAASKFNAAIENTANGQPVDVSKPFFAGKHGDKILDFFAEVKKLQDALPADVTQELHQAKLQAVEANKLVEALEKSDVDKADKKVLHVMEPEAAVA